MKRIVMSFVLFVLILFVSGCSYNSQYSQPPAHWVRHAYATNYKVGEVKTAYIGESIVKVKDYYSFQNNETNFYLTPTEDFTLTANVQMNYFDYKLNISGKKGDKYEPYYKADVDGILYDLMYFTDSNGNNNYAVIIDNEGNIKDNAIFGRKFTDFRLQPSNVKFKKSVITADNFICNANINYTSNTCGDVNYELIYSGMNNVSLNVTYREYSRDDHAKPSFYQNITFEPHAKQIRYKNLVIDIIKATNDKLVYKISSDGLKMKEFHEREDPDYDRIKASLETKSQINTK